MTALRHVLLLFLLWRGGLFCLALVGLNLTQPFPPQDPPVLPKHYFLDAWLHWDALHYLDIAARGYRLDPSEPKYGSPVVFFPLYPWLVRCLGALVGLPAAALLVANLSSLGALWYLRRIALRYLDEQQAELALVLLLVFPTSFFLSAGYSEGLYLLTSTACTDAFLSRRYLRCGMWGFLAALTRSAGVLHVVLFGGAVLLRLVRRQERFSPAMMGLLLIPAGLGVYMLLLHVQVGDALAFARYQARWQRHTAFPLSTLAVALAKTDWSFPRDAANMQRLLDFLFAIGCLGIGVAMLRRFPPVLGLLPILGVLLPLSTGRLLSMSRFVLVQFPIFLYLAQQISGRPAERPVIFVFAFLLCMYMLNFLNWGWAG
ncbi:MAG: mannosyltransferase family protein [Myxococcales bacterium]|nr:hypothetical protein [Myxococcota bacterium]MDW8282914.1 mannosyltransferase family protein [Myxococcales bacterium]